MLTAIELSTKKESLIKEKNNNNFNNNCQLSIVIDDLVTQAKEQGLLTAGYEKWLCKAAWRLGAERIYQLMSEARQEGRNKGRYFTWLINRATNETA